MTFTDDDLKHWITVVQNNPHEFIKVRRVELEAIIARLEAAENLSETRRIYIELPQDEFDASDGDGPLIYEEMKKEEKAWRNAAGKCD